jgi:hypothetical protein
VSVTSDGLRPVTENACVIAPVLVNGLREETCRAEGTVAEMTGVTVTPGGGTELRTTALEIPIPMYTNDGSDHVILPMATNVTMGLFARLLAYSPSAELTEISAPRAKLPAATEITFTVINGFACVKVTIELPQVSPEAAERVSVTTSEESAGIVCKENVTFEECPTGT